MIAATTIVVVLAFVSLVCGFKHALVVVLEDNEFLPALAARGVTKELHFGSRTDSVVSSLRKSHLTWRFYIQDSNMPCSLDSSLQEKYNFLISPEDKVGKSECAHISDTDGTIALYAFEPPAIGFYFPENGADPNWLRRFVDLTLFSPLFEDTLIVILSQVSYTDSTASLLFLGKGVQQHTESLDATLLTNMMTHFGFAVIDPPTTFRGNSNHLSFEKIFIVVLENQPLKVTIKDKHFRKFVSRGTLLTNYNALINPSQPNYFAMTAGDTRGCTGDDPIDVTGRFVVDLFEEHNITWKAYMEAYPGNCFTGGKFGRYRRKHNPFISFPQVRNNPELCSKVVHSDQLKIDVEANELPQYSFYTPDMDNDGHDTGIAYAGRWLNRFLSPLLNSQSFMKGTLVVVTFDEGIKPDNKIYTLLLGDMIPSGHLDNTNYTHYSLLRMVEDQFSLPTLGRFDANASHINASNFYPGKIPMPSNWPYIIGGTSLGVGVLATIGAAVYYKQVVRKRKFGPKVAREESKEGESQMFLRSVGVSEWQTPGNDTDSGGSDNSV